MRLNRERKLAVLGGAAVLILLILIALAYLWHAHARSALPAVPTATAFAGELDIPKIRVHAKIISVGLTPDGAMDTPRGPQDVGWFSLGTRPGGEGSAVIGGHRGWKDGIPAVFDHLDELRIGDTISIVDDHGKKLTFVVRETRTYGKDASPPEVFTSTSGAHLNLITCVGDWNAGLKSTTERLVVFTDLVS